MAKHYGRLTGILVYFLLTALVGAFIGKFIDNQFSTEPYGTVGSLVIFYMISWIGIYIYIKKKGF